MKVGIILYQNMRHAPFLRIYEDILRGISGLEYDVVYLDRHPELNEAIDNHHIPIKWVMSSKMPPLFSKIFSAVGYPFQVAKVLKEKDYDYLILLTTMPAVLLYPYLKKRYKSKYVVDIRDYTRENWRWYYGVEKRVVENSAVNVISSHGFLNFLPPAQYHLCHNLNVTENEIQNHKYSFDRTESAPITITYVGNIQYAEYCNKLVDLVAKDPRFKLYFYGGEGGKKPVTEHVEQLACDRIKMFGPFVPGDKPRIFTESSIVFNCYGNDSPLVRFAISNKQYDAAFYRRPLLVSPETTMAELVGDNGCAFDVLNADNLDAIYEWFNALDCAKFESYAQGVLDKALMDNKQTKEIIRSKILDRTKP